MSSWVDQVISKYRGLENPEEAVEGRTKLSAVECWDGPWADVHSWFINSTEHTKRMESKEEKVGASCEKSLEDKEDDVVIHESFRLDVCCVSEIWNGLFLGNLDIASSKYFLDNHKIRNVVNCTPTIAFCYPKDKNLRVAIDDSADSPWEKTLVEVLEYLDRCYCSQKPVLVHCRMGQSRSVSYVIAWAMLRFNVDFQKILKTLDKKRHGINVNIGFRTKLGMIAESLGMQDMICRGSGTKKRKYLSLVSSPRAKQMRMSEIGNSLRAKSYVGIQYVNRGTVTKGKMNLEGKMEKITTNADGSEEVGVYSSTLEWETLVANSRAKNFSKNASICSVDGKPLANGIVISFKEFRACIDPSVFIPNDLYEADEVLV
jgi:hypothetical protein